MQGQNLSKAILDAIEVYTNEKIKTSTFVKTEIGIVSGVGTKKGNKINLKGAEYDNVKSIGNIIFPKGCVVFLFIPNGQYSNMFILGQLDDTPANIVGGTINIGNGNFKVDENGNANVGGNLNISGKIVTHNRTKLDEDVVGLYISDDGFDYCWYYEDSFDEDYNCYAHFRLDKKNGLCFLCNGKILEFSGTPRLDGGNVGGAYLGISRAYIDDLLKR